MKECVKFTKGRKLFDKLENFDCLKFIFYTEHQKRLDKLFEIFDEFKGKVILLIVTNQ